MRANPHVHARHAAAFVRYFVLPLSAGLVAPLLVVAQGALPMAQIIALSACMMPLSAVLLLQRGHAMAASLVQTFALVALAAILVQGSGLFLAGFAFFSLACLEASLSGRREVLMAIVFAAMASVALVMMRALLPPHGATIPDLGLAVFALGLAIQMVMQIAGESARQDEERAGLLRQQSGFESVFADSRLHFSRAGAVTFIDPACARQLGLSRRDLSGRGFFERVQMADRPALIKTLGNALDNKSMETLLVRVHVKDDESPRGRFVTPVFATLELRLKAIDDNHVMGFIRDVSELVEAQAIIAAHRAAGIEDRDWKDQLIANVSHELRTPLNAIIGFSEVLGADHTHDERLRREYAAIINASGQHLLSLVNSILDVSQMEAGALNLAQDRLCFADLVDECCDMLRLQAEQAGIMLRRQVQREAHEMVADKRICRQILINLVSNAIKFTPRGGSVTIHAQQAGQDLLLAISDTGCGIAPEHLPQLGQAFYQASASGLRPAEGTGLGLALVKNLVALQDGAMKIESTPGQGTCVTIRLPLAGRPDMTGHEWPVVQTSVPHPPAASLPDMMMVKKIA